MSSTPKVGRNRRCQSRFRMHFKSEAMVFRPFLCTLRLKPPFHPQRHKISDLRPVYTTRECPAGTLQACTHRWTAYTLGYADLVAFQEADSASCVQNQPYISNLSGLFKEVCMKNGQSTLIEWTWCVHPVPLRWCIECLCHTSGGCDIMSRWFHRFRGLIAACVHPFDAGMDAVAAICCCCKCWGMFFTLLNGVPIQISEWHGLFRYLNRPTYSDI